MNTPTTTEGTMESETVQQARRDIVAAEATIAKCEARMATCPPRSRFAYASQITKAEAKRSRAEHIISRSTRGW